MEDVDGEDERTYYQCHANFHWLAKCIHVSQLRRKIWTEVQTTPVAAGGAALPAKMVASARDVVVDDFERSRWSTGWMVRRSASMVRMALFVRRMRFGDIYTAKALFDQTGYFVLKGEERRGHFYC